jgi:fermentation-respiration switch protein FrsA (DUF1100 family)
MEAAMTLLKALVVGLVAFGGLVALMYFAQRSLMYFPERGRTTPAAAGTPSAQEVVLDTADGEKVIAWHVPARDGKPLFLYFHGNGGSLRYRTARYRALTATGHGLVALSYRGYGGSSGSPSETGLIADAEAAYRFALTHAPAERIVLYGESLGGGVAVALAAPQKVGAVSAVKAPLLVLHGARDTIVPIGLGERLFALANEPKRMLRFAEGGHLDLEQFGATNAVLKFVAEVLP